MEIRENPPGDSNRCSVTVVIPTRGRSQLVRRAIGSALAQTLRRIEVIVVVDGDDPPTLSALSQIRDERLIVIPLICSVGAAEARNFGVRSARAEWIAFLDDDDEWLPGKLESQLSRARKSSAQMPVVCSAYIARSGCGDAVFGRRAPVEGEPVSEYMFCRKSFSYGENAIATSVLFAPKSLLLSVPFDRNLSRHQDWDWALRALRTPGTCLCYLPQPLTIYHMPEGEQRMSAHNDWQYSLQWCRDRKSLFTPRAVSFFIATECITRARQARAAPGEIAGLLTAFWREGRPNWRSTLLAIGYLFFSRSSRRVLAGRPIARSKSGSVP